MIVQKKSMMVSIMLYLCKSNSSGSLAIRSNKDGDDEGHDEVTV